MDTIIIQCYLLLRRRSRLLYCRRGEDHVCTRRGVENCAGVHHPGWDSRDGGELHPTPQLHG